MAGSQPKEGGEAASLQSHRGGCEHKAMLHLSIMVGGAGRLRDKPIPPQGSLSRHWVLFIKPGTAPKLLSHSLGIPTVYEFTISLPSLGFYPFPTTHY